jgi:Domain of unknown function (DUF4331)
MALDLLRFPIRLEFRIRAQEFDSSNISISGQYRSKYNFTILRTMSHHLESPSSREDGRVDITDMFVFPGERPNTTVLVLNVNPDAGLSSPKTFRPDALYEFKIDTDGDIIENLGFRLRFGQPTNGSQSVKLLRVQYSASTSNGSEEAIATGQTNKVIETATGIRLWAGLAGDPFFADAHALDVFQNALFKKNKLDMSAFGSRTFVFGVGRNVTSIVLELPNSEFPAEVLNVWSATYIWKEDKRIQINRYGKPLIMVLFFRVDDHRAEAYNRTHPKNDVTLYSDYIAGIVSRITKLGNTATNPVAYGRDVSLRLLPDVMSYRVGSTNANYALSRFNGREFSEDTFDLMMRLVTNKDVSDGVVSSRRHRSTFPYVPPLYSVGEQKGFKPYLPHTHNPTT